MALMPGPLSWYEKQERVRQLRKEAGVLLDEALRIEIGIEKDLEIIRGQLQKEKIQNVGKVAC